MEFDMHKFWVQSMTLVENQQSSLTIDSLPENAAPGASLGDLILMVEFRCCYKLQASCKSSFFEHNSRENMFA